MAWRWEKAFDIGLDGMPGMQATYDAAQIRRKVPGLGITPNIPPQSQGHRDGWPEPAATDQALPEP